MAFDYYAVLECQPDASLHEIHSNYRRLALDSHPDKPHDNPTSQKLKFLQIGEAYDVLRDPFLRQLYDELGVDGLSVKFTCLPAYPHGYRYHGQPLRTFEEHFGTIHAFADDYLSREGTAEYNLYSDIYRARDKSQLPPIIIELDASLEELFYGSIREVEYRRLVVSEDGSDLYEEIVVKNIHVQPGWRAGVQAVFEKEGNQAQNMIPSDVVVQIIELPHDRFTRDGNDLRIKVEVDLLVALCGGDISLNSIDDRPIRIEETNIIKPGSIRRIEGYGMPTGKTDCRGDLYLDYDVVFPGDMDLARRDMVANALTARPSKVAVPTTLLSITGPEAQLSPDYFNYYPQTPVTERHTEIFVSGTGILQRLEHYG